MQKAEPLAYGIDPERFAVPVNQRWQCGLALLVLLIAMLLAAWLPVTGGSVIGGAWRYVDPLGDHPPMTRVIFETRADVPAFWRDPIYVHDGEPLWLQSSVRGQEVRNVEMTIEWADGRREQISLQPQDMPWSPPVVNHVINGINQPMRWQVRGEHARSRWNVVVPVVSPRVERLELTVVNKAERFPITTPSPEPLRLAVASQLHIKVIATPADAVLVDHTHEPRERLVRIEPGEQQVTLSLVMPDGTRTHEPTRLTVIGLPQSEIDRINAELAGGQLPEDAISLPVAADALAAAVAFGSPEDAAAAELASGTPVDAQPTGDEPNENGTGNTGDGVGGDRQPTEPPPLVDAVGVLAERYNVTGDDLQKLRRLVATAPPAYRDLVAEYLMQMRERE